MPNQFEITRQQYESHRVNEDFDPNEPELSPKNDNFSEVNVRLMILFNCQVFKLIKFTHQDRVFSILKDVGVNVDH